MPKARLATGAEGSQTGVGGLLRGSLTDGAQLLLMGAMVAGLQAARHS